MSNCHKNGNNIDSKSFLNFLIKERRTEGGRKEKGREGSREGSGREDVTEIRKEGRTEGRKEGGME